MGCVMVGIDFISFVILLVIAVIVAAIAHYGLNYYVVGGPGSFLSKVVIAWLGAWLGSPVFGHWFAPLVYENIYIIPAVLGSVAIIILVVDVARTCGAGGEA